MDFGASEWILGLSEGMLVWGVFVWVTVVELASLGVLGGPLGAEGWLVSIIGNLNTKSGFCKDLSII